MIRCYIFIFLAIGTLHFSPDACAWGARRNFIAPWISIQEVVDLPDQKIEQLGYSSDIDLGWRCEQTTFGLFPVTPPKDCQYVLYKKTQRKRTRGFRVTYPKARELALLANFDLPEEPTIPWIKYYWGIIATFLTFGPLSGALIYLHNFHPMNKKRQP